MSIRGAHAVDMQVCGAEEKAREAPGQVHVSSSQSFDGRGTWRHRHHSAPHLGPFASQQLTSVASGSTTTFVAQDDKLPQFGPKSVVAAIEAVKAGKIIVVTDDEDRENEGDLIMAAEFATPETIGFIRRYSSGVICVAVRCRMLASQQKGSW
eukprot:scaffold122711_cov69-Phaeocystis_antarctica.AAC.3